MKRSPTTQSARTTVRQTAPLSKLERICARPSGAQEVLPALPQAAIHFTLLQALSTVSGVA